MIFRFYLLILAISITGCVTPKSHMLAQTQKQSADAKTSVLTKISSDNMANLYLYRKDSPELGKYSSKRETEKGYETHWTINGVEVGSFRGFGFIKLSVVPGKHDIKAKLIGDRFYTERVLTNVQAGDNIYVRFSRPVKGPAIILSKQSQTHIHLAELDYYKSVVASIGKNYISTEDKLETELYKKCTKEDGSGCRYFVHKFPNSIHINTAKHRMAQYDKKQQRLRIAKQRQAKARSTYVRNNPIKACQEVANHAEYKAGDAYKSAKWAYQHGCETAVNKFNNETIKDWQKHYYGNVARGVSLEKTFERNVLRCFERILKNPNENLSEAQKAFSSIRDVPGCKAEKARVKMSNAEGLINELKAYRDELADSRSELRQLDKSYRQAYRNKKAAQNQAMFNNIVNSIHSIGTDVNATMTRINRQSAPLWKMKRESDRKIRLEEMERKQKEHLKEARRKQQIREHAQSRAKTTVQVTNRSAQQRGSSSQTDSASDIKQQARTSTMLKQNSNRGNSNSQEKLGTVRSVEVTGDSDAFYQDSSHARRLAQLEVQSVAYDACESSYHAEIEWIDNSCKIHESLGQTQYRCRQNAVIQCRALKCSERYCGTGIK